MTLLGGKGLVCLDLLRTIAALSVAVAHFFLFCRIDSALAEMVAILAVEVFFVLSGFVLARQLNQCIDSGSAADLKVFYWRRWIRTLPPFLVALLLTSAVTSNLATPEFWKYLVFLKNFSVANDVNDYFAVTWSLAVEEWFYVIFPLALVVLTRLGMTANGAALAFATMILFIKLSYVLGAPDEFVTGRRIVLARLDAIAAGYLLFNVRKHRLLTETPVIWLAIVAAASLAIGSVALMSRHVIVYMYAISAFACLLLVLFLRAENLLVRSRAVRLLSAAGANLSYTIYLCHTFVFLALAGGTARTAGVGLFVVYLAAVVAFALLSFLLLEAPLLGARPSYAHSKGRDGGVRSRAAQTVQGGRPLGVLRIAACNLMVCVGLLALAEGGAALVLRGYAWLSGASASHPAADRSASLAPAGHLAVYSDPYVSSDLQRHRDMAGSPYRYQSYLTYAYRPFASRHVNIDEEGVRRTGPERPTDQGREIWIFGSSPVFGATNGDTETVSSYAQAYLAGRPGWEGVTIVNFGVVGYTATQDLLHFQHRLRTRVRRPTAVVFINAHNDYNLAWLSQAPRCDGLLETAVGSSRVLKESWELRSHGEVVVWSDIGARLRAIFPAAQELARLFAKFFTLRASSADVEAWKTDYTERVERTRASSATCVEQARGSVLRSMAAAVQIARLEGIETVIIPQPFLAAARKPLIGVERDEMQLLDDAFFAIDPAELAALRHVPRHRLDQLHVWDKARYVQDYGRMKEDLRGLAERSGSIYLDLDQLIEKHPNEQIYSSSIHYTFKGARLIGERIAQELDAKLPR
jgi:peptidoglycan/LPS O-acetylase OafA/YrhL